MPSPFRVQVSLTADQMTQIQESAALLNTTAASLIRDRALSTGYNSRSFATAVEAAATTIPGLPRAQVEHLVAKVIQSLAAPS